MDTDSCNRNAKNEKVIGSECISDAEDLIGLVDSLCIGLAEYSTCMCSNYEIFRMKTLTLLSLLLALENTC